MREFLKGIKSLSIIGMQKNAGKTTCLNSILAEMTDVKIGLTSIGRDGELEDSVYKVRKPSIFVTKGTIVATTTEALDNTGAEYSVLLNTKMNTPMGIIYIVEITKSGFIDLAGPSYNKQINEVYDFMKTLDIELFIVDGAFSRKQMASNKSLDATILVTGAAYHKDIDVVVKETGITYKLFTLPKTKLNNAKVYFDNAVTLIGSKVIVLDLHTSLGSPREIVSSVEPDTKYLILNGALTKELVDEFVNNRHRINELTILIKDGTKAFIDYESYDYLNKMNIKLEVLNDIKLLCLVYNPYSPLGYEFDDLEFRNKLTEVIDIPIVNVLKRGKIL